MIDKCNLTGRKDKEGIQRKERDRQEDKEGRGGYICRLKLGKT